MQRRRADTAAGSWRAPQPLPASAAPRPAALTAPAVPPEGIRAARSQRERLLDAMIAVAATGGYGSASVARVSRAAGVSSATFYELFKDREDCLLAAYRTVAVGLRDHADPPGASSTPTVRAWCEQARSALEGTIGILEQHRNGARVLLFEAAAAGNALSRERALTEEALVQRARALLQSTPSGAPVVDLPAVALVGAVRGVVALRLLAGEELDAPVLAGELVGWLRSYARRDGLRFSAGPGGRLAHPGASAGVGVGLGLAALPRGRHGLPAAAVSESQRIRIINATAEVVSRDGYAATSVRNIVAGARISRAVFYKHFAGKQDALLEAQHDATRTVLAACDAVFCTGEPWPTRVYSVLRVLLEALASAPAMSDLCLLWPYAAGPLGLQHVEGLPRVFASFLEEGYTLRIRTRRPPRIYSDAITSAIHHIIRRDVAAGETASLPQRLPELAYIALAPFNGATEAAKTVERLSAA